MKDNSILDFIKSTLPYLSILIQALFFWILKNIYDHIALKEKVIIERLNSIKEHIDLFIEYKEKEVNKLSNKIEELERELNELKIEIAKLVSKITNGDHKK